MTIEFSEDVTDFTAGDIEVTNSTKSDFTKTDAANYTVRITPTADGAVTVSVPADAVTDTAGHDNTASNTLTRTADVTAPTVTLTSTSSANVSGAFDVTIEFSEDVTDFTASDIEVTNSTKSQFTTTDDANYTIRITPTADGQVTVKVPANAATDTAGHNNTASNTLTRTADVTAPTVTLTSTSSATVSGAFDVTIEFSEDVTDFTIDDIEVTNSTKSQFTTTDDANYTIRITPTADGQVTVQSARQRRHRHRRTQQHRLQHPEPHRRRHRPHRHPQFRILKRHCQRRLRGRLSPSVKTSPASPPATSKSPTAPRASSPRPTTPTTPSA